MNTVKTNLLLCCLFSAPVLADDFPGEVYELGAFERFEASGVSYFSGRLAVVDDTFNSLFLFDARGDWIETLDSEHLPSQRAKMLRFTAKARRSSPWARTRVGPRRRFGS